ncbi:MAG: hypothetical protein LQ352_007537 [Teloschistes flavicans]|nr:MAG: hypothetical protein LQ352_007537 [Teloschistes flavicans]
MPSKKKSKAKKKTGNTPSNSSTQQPAASTDTQSSSKPRSATFFDYGFADKNLESDLKSADAYRPPPGNLFGFIGKISDSWAGRAKDADEKEWADAHHNDPTVDAEHLYEDSDEPTSREDAEAKIQERKQAGGRLLIDDREIYEAWEDGEDAVKVLIDREHRAILTVYGKPAKRTITEDDLAILYTQYEKHFTEPGHQVGECKDCEDKADGKYALFSVAKKPRLDLDNHQPDPLWHYPSESPFPDIKKAYGKYKKAYNGFGKQKEKEPIIAENEKREAQGKKTISLHESRVERIIRELDEGIRVAPYAGTKKAAEKIRAAEEAELARKAKEEDDALTDEDRARKAQEEKAAAEETRSLFESLHLLVSFLL